MKNFLQTKPYLLIAPLFAIGATSITACSESDTKAVDRVEEAEAIARVKSLEAQATEIKNELAENPGAKLNISMPAESTIPDDEYGAAVRRGLELANHTYRELPDNVGNKLNCTSCHLANGSEAYAAPWNGLPGIFPIYRSRDARVNSLQERVNGCFQRSMNGTPLEVDSDEMNAFISYMTWLSQDMPIGVSPPGRGFVEVDSSLTPDPVKGKEVFAATCTTCHGENGEGKYNDDGTYIYPAIAGADSFNDGAGMARTYKAAAFVKGKMPFGQGNTLTDQEAIDVASYSKFFLNKIQSL
ncbi:c-type cytochrome [Psychrobacter sp.]|uniref:c-type cytochrome n=1 Tax=Psychrobacter sp. TaxID=56811 RepID=UPI002647DE2F|nr:c-type cytochrome [Psychrobacter sp.]MDN6308353.1 c-type cytochrome [Psychrobacter sp.]